MAARLASLALARFNDARPNGGVDEPDGDTPILVSTTVGWRPESLGDMNRIQEFGAAVAAVRISMSGVPGLHSQNSFSFPGGLTHDRLTVTTWSNFAAMREWAYGPGLHPTVVKRQREERLGDRTSLTRFVVVRSSGTWHGVNPFAR